MLLLITNIERQTSDVHNKTFGSAEVILFQNAYSGIFVAPTIYKTCEKQIPSTFQYSLYTQEA